MRWTRQPGVRSGGLAGLAVFVAGFGVLNLFWWFGDWQRGLPGLWDYRSATIGDGLLLPIAAAILTTAGTRLPRASNEVIVIGGAGALGSCGGVVVITLWVLDHDPAPNWSQPAPHVLSAAGIYHAVFLIIVSGFFAACAMRVLWRARWWRMTHPLEVGKMVRSPAASLLIGCVLGFVGLVMLDSYPTLDKGTSITATGAVLVVSFLVVASLMWSFGNEIVRAWPSIVLGVIVSGVIVLGALMIW